MSISVLLPKPHTLRAKWAPLNFYPFPGSGDRLTIAVVVVGPDGKSVICEAEGLTRLNCLFGNEAAKYISYARQGIQALRELAGSDVSGVLERNVSLGGAFELGPFQPGSGHDLQEIAHAWLNKVSMLATAPEYDRGGTELALAQESFTQRRPRLIPAVREEMAAIAPLLIDNFARSFQPEGKALPVRIGYKGTKIVADFSRLDASSINSSLERVRGKLWMLSEHRDQTRHEHYREHEMLVIRKTASDERYSPRELSILDRACDDLMEEADRREIRLRPLGSPKAVAQRIFQAEMSGNLQMN